jgi:hypothetical protein
LGRKGKRKAGKLLRVYHRRAGIVSVLVVLMLTVTGISLNHIDGLFHQSPYVKAGWLLNWYGIEAGDVQSFRRASESDNEFSIIMNEGTLIVEEQAVLFGQQALLGVVPYDELNHVFTRESLHIFTDEGELVESMSLPEIAQESYTALWLGEAPEQVILESGNQGVVFSLDSLDMTQGDGLDFSVAGTSTLSSGSNEDVALARQFMLLKSRVLTDIHSGRILGPVGPWLVDLFALVFLSLALSGLVIWFRRKG